MEARALEGKMSRSWCEEGAVDSGTGRGGWGSGEARGPTAVRGALGGTLGRSPGMSAGETDTSGAQRRRGAAGSPRRRPATRGLTPSVTCPGSSGTGSGASPTRRGSTTPLGGRREG